MTFKFSCMMEYRTRSEKSKSFSIYVYLCLSPTQHKFSNAGLNINFLPYDCLSPLLTLLLKDINIFGQLYIINHLCEAAEAVGILSFSF